MEQAGAGQANTLAASGTSGWRRVVDRADSLPSAVTASPTVWERLDALERSFSGKRIDDEERLVAAVWYVQWIWAHRY